MLWTIFVILLVLWLVGLVSSYTLGGFIHILLVIAIVVLIIQLLSGRRALYPNNFEAMKPAGIIGIILIVIGISLWCMAGSRTPSAKRCWISARFRRLRKSKRPSRSPRYWAGFVWSAESCW